jgi:L-ascorbate metabolism protein UlaG (beta-lactamase superfamily)
MEITWYGHSCFRLAERGYATIATDPFDSSLGYEVPRIKADIVTVSHEAPGHNHVNAVKGAREIRGPGEYEIGSVFITGISTSRFEGAAKKRKDDSQNHRNTLYLFDYNGVTVCHLGDLSGVPTQTQIESLGTVGIALVPVGGGGGLNAAQAAEVISLIEPSIVIPMHYRTGVSTVKLDPLSKFLKEMGLGNLKPQDGLKVTKSQLLNYKGEDAG